MSYKCQICNKLIESNIPTNKVVAKKRTRTYNYYVVKVKNPHGKVKTIVTEDKVIAEAKNNQILKQFESKGWEIVEEKVACKECFNKEEKNETA